MNNLFFKNTDSCIEGRSRISGGYQTRWKSNGYVLVLVDNTTHIQVINKYFHCYYNGELKAET